MSMAPMFRASCIPSAAPLAAASITFLGPGSARSSTVAAVASSLAVAGCVASPASATGVAARSSRTGRVSGIRILASTKAAGAAITLAPNSCSANSCCPAWTGMPATAA